MPSYTLPQGIQDGLRARKHITAIDEFAVVQAVVEIMNGDVCSKNDPKKLGWPEGFKKQKCFYLCFYEVSLYLRK